MSTLPWFAFAFLLFGCATPDAGVNGSPTMPLPIPSGIAYGDDPQQRLDLLVPEGKQGEPLVAFVHGGAWQGGTRHEYDGIAKRFQSEGLAVATIDYRLSPTVRHPAHAEDVARALGWLVSHAEEKGYDPKRIFVVGHSAGGHIAGTIATSSSLLAQAQPAGFVGLEGIYDIPDLAKRWPTYPEWFLNNAFGADPAQWPVASPTRAKVVSRAPWLVVHSKGDELVDAGQADGFAAHLRTAGVKVEVLRPEHDGHDAVVHNLERPNDAVAKAILAFARGKK